MGLPYKISAGCLCQAQVVALSEKNCENISGLA
jgi:hypothetical protein